MTRLRAAAALFACLSAAGLSACGSSGNHAGASGGSGSGPATGPIVIGAAVDDTSFLKPTDQPPLAAAKLEIAKINAAGGVDGRRLELKVINTQLDPEKTKSAATELIDSDKSAILWTSCDVDLATPAIQVALTKQVLTVAPCIGTDQMGPKRFGDAGKIAFSFGNVAQDEGAAMALAAQKKGWRTANVITDKSLVYLQNVCQAFTIKFKQLGGQVKAQETFTSGDNTIGGVASKINRSAADVNVLCTTAAKDLPAFVTGLRGLGNQSAIFGPWSIDGEFWLPRSAKAATNIHYVTFASAFGDDPDPKVNALAKQLAATGAAPQTGGFIAGAEAIDALAAAIKENHGSTDADKLAGALRKMRDFKTSVGAISFSDQFSTVFGREYRIIDITDGHAKFGGTVRADQPVTLPGS
jgi:branched-chain amino acid transport system substrate-binding protein